MTVTLQDLLERRLGVDEAAFRAALADFAERSGALVLTEVRPVDHFGPTERSTLTALGASLEPLAAPHLGPVAGLAAAYGALVSGSLRVSEVAERLGVDPSRVRQRIHARSLYAFRHRSTWLIPAFQIDQGRVLAGLPPVLAALAPDLHPVAATRWLTTPTGALELDGEAVSPVAWLRSGSDPAVVAAAAAAVDEV